MLVPVRALRGLRDTCGALREWIRGRHRLAREREDRATAELVLRDLAEGGLWLDRDGPRLRLITKATDAQDGIRRQMEQVDGLLQLEQGSGVTADE